VADVIFSTDPADIADPFLTDWTDHPTQGRIDVPRVVTKSLQSYHYEEATITIDIAGPPMRLSRCTVQGFNYNFASGDDVLLGDNLPGTRPVHLTFAPALRALGAQVSASGPVNSNYRPRLRVRLDDGTEHEMALAAPVPLTRRRGSAPFLGAEASNGRTIAEAWFDLADAANPPVFQAVAINHLLWLDV
jgi:hypothetical protein